MDEFENLLPPLQAIKYKCYDCSGWNWKEVKECDRVKCTLYPYRMGHHPKLKGKGGNVANLKRKTPTCAERKPDNTQG